MSRFDDMEQAQLLRVYLGESDHSHGKVSLELILEAARKAGLAGATVLRGSLGYGADSIIHKVKLWQLSSDLPVVIEMVDRPENIEAFLPELESLLPGGGLITLETVRMFKQAKE